MKPKAQLEDLDPMPFGQHKGSPMQDVPAHYLHYLWSNGLKKEKTLLSDGGRVADYIRRRLNHLKTEHPDGIWS